MLLFVCILSNDLRWVIAEWQNGDTIDSAHEWSVVRHYSSLAY